MPFAVVALLAEASIALPPGPRSVADAEVSGILLALVAASFLLPWHRLPGVLTVAVPLAYIASVLFMILSAGGSTSGIGIVVLIGLVWTALYHTRWESFVVVLGIVTVEIITSLTPQAVSGTVLSRRVFFWSALGLLIATASHDLRDRARRNSLARDEQHRRTESLVMAAQELSASLSQFEVLSTATRLSAELASPTGVPGKRAQYIRANEGVVRLVAQFDDTGQFVARSFAISEHAILEEVMRTGLPVQWEYSPEDVGPTVRQMMEGLGIRHSVYVPVYCRGEVDGVLTVAMRGTAASAEVFEQCKAIGHLIELALSNAMAHDELAELATTDALTGLRNRRGFDQYVQNRPGRRPFGIIAIDVDGLKLVNDTRGHGAGDAFLVHVAKTLSSALRRGDVIARIGGDEFVAFLFDADEDAGRRVAARMLDALRNAPFDGEAPRVSLGLGCGYPATDVTEVHEEADQAMYSAKRRGGGQCIVAGSLKPDSLPIASS